LVNELYCDRAFADAGRDTLDRAVAHISCDEDTGNAGFQQKWLALERPATRPAPVAFL